MDLTTDSEQDKAEVERFREIYAAMYGKDNEEEALSLVNILFELSLLNLLCEIVTGLF